MTTPPQTPRSQTRQATEDDDQRRQKVDIVAAPYGIQFFDRPAATRTASRRQRLRARSRDGRRHPFLSTRRGVEAPAPGASATVAADPLCVCGHLASYHAEAGSGDTRCLAVEDRRDLVSVVADGREVTHGYCACLRFTTASSNRKDVQ